MSPTLKSTGAGHFGPNLRRKVLTDYSRILKAIWKTHGLSYAKGIISISSAVWAQCKTVTDVHKAVTDIDRKRRNRLSVMSPRNVQNHETAKVSVETSCCMRNSRAFYARQYAIARICYRLSVCPSVTRVDQSKTVEWSRNFHHFIPLVFQEQVLSRNFDGFPWLGALNDGGVSKWAIFGL